MTTIRERPPGKSTSFHTDEPDVRKNSNDGGTAQLS
jgi:hypothetical protein